jgi:hypothetical protein
MQTPGYWTLLPAAFLLGAAGGTSLHAADKPYVELLGTDFAGGANGKFGANFYGRDHVNYVYARSNGAYSRMRATFDLKKAPREPVTLLVEACVEGPGESCDVELALGDRVIFRGPSGFDRTWRIRRFPIPAGMIREGTNELTVTNGHPTGPLGMPPFFMVSWCALAGKDYKPPRPETIDTLVVELPPRLRPLPEPLPAGQSHPGFKIRGTKGYAWNPEQYLEEVPVLAKHKMNFLMNCYLSMFDDRTGRNEWWAPLPDAKKRGYEAVARACREHGVEFCFCINPNLGAARFVRADNAKDLDDLWQHYAWIQSLGVKWFSICLDDISQGIDAKTHAAVVNEILRRLRVKDPQSQMIFCPTHYAGDGTGNGVRPYNETLARQLHADVYLFWTGDQVVGPLITRRAAESFKKILKHRLILWDNYPVNDAGPTMHLGPVTGREADLCQVIDGYMGNPLRPQNRINRIPLLTCADYAYNPKGYDPFRSIGQAILHLAETPEQRQVLKELVESYPGMLIFGGGTQTNPVRERYRRLALASGSRAAAEAYVRSVEALSKRFERAFPNQFPDAKKTLGADVAWLKESLAKAAQEPDR